MYAGGGQTAPMADFVKYSCEGLSNVSKIWLHYVCVFLFLKTKCWLENIYIYFAHFVVMRCFDASSSLFIPFQLLFELSASFHSFHLSCRRVIGGRQKFRENKKRKRKKRNLMVQKYCILGREERCGIYFGKRCCFFSFFFVFQFIFIFIN